MVYDSSPAREAPLPQRFSLTSPYVR